MFVMICNSNIVFSQLKILKYKNLDEKPLKSLQNRSQREFLSKIVGKGYFNPRLSKSRDIADVSSHFQWERSHKVVPLWYNSVVLG